jgi:hypothetical protein
VKLRHIILGSAGWLTAIVFGYLATRAELDNQSSSLSELTTGLQQWVAGARRSAVAESAVPLYVALDDPIFMATADNRFIQTGYVSSVDGTRRRDPVAVANVQIAVYDRAIEQFPNGYRLEYCTTPMHLEWAVATMIPEERRLEIMELVRREWHQHQQVVLAQLQPVLKEGIRRAIKAVEAELPYIIDNHRDDFRHLGDRFEAEILQEELVPLVRDEIFPIIQEEVRPLAMEIGGALWNRVSLISFTWRYLYDASPLPERHAVRTEFQRFIDQEAVPELEAHTEEFIEITKVIINRVMKNERVRNTLRNNIQRVVEDPELQHIVGKIVREATVDNAVLRQSLKDYLKSDETRTAMRVAGDRLENMVRAIGDLIFGTREQGITSEFSRVLRSQVLRKDRRWFIMVPDDANTDSDTVTITEALEPMLYPLKFSGQRQSPLTPESRRH